MTSVWPAEFRPGRALRSRSGLPKSWRSGSMVLSARKRVSRSARNGSDAVRVNKRSIMLNNDAARNVFRSPIAVAAISAAMILTGSVQPSHAAIDVFAAFKNSGSIVSDKPIVTLRVPGGLYAIFGKINIDQDDTVKWVTVVCTLQAGGDVDRDVSRLQPSGGTSVDNAAIRLQLVNALPSDALTTLPCPANSTLLKALCSHSGLPKSRRSGLMAKAASSQAPRSACLNEQLTQN